MTDKEIKDKIDESGMPTRLAQQAIIAVIYLFWLMVTLVLWKLYPSGITTVLLSIFVVLSGVHLILIIFQIGRLANLYLKIKKEFENELK